MGIFSSILVAMAFFCMSSENNWKFAENPAEKLKQNFDLYPMY